MVIGIVSALVVVVVIVAVAIAGSSGGDGPSDVALDPDPPVTVPAMVVGPTDTPTPPTLEPATTTSQFPTVPPSPTARELGYTVTPPPLPLVHVAEIETVYDVYDGETEVIHWVEILDSFGSPVRDARITLAILEASGKEFKIEGETGELGEAYLDYTTASMGIHSAFVVNITGPVTWKYAGGDGTTYEKFLPVFKNVEAGAIGARIPVTWSWSSESAEIDGADIIYAAPNLISWKTVLEDSDGLEVGGFATVVIPVPESEGPVDGAVVEEFFLDLGPPENCAELLESNDIHEDTTGLSRVERRFQCGDGGIAVLEVRYSPAMPNSLVFTVARLMTPDEIEYLDVMFDGLEWVSTPETAYKQYDEPPLFTIDLTASYTAIIRTSSGNIAVELYAAAAPITVNNFVFLANEGFYEGTIFHRVIPNFMIQGGDPTGTGTSGPGYQFEDEIVPGLVFDQQGILAMANSGPNTNGSQFFITTVPTPHLNGNHTIFGKVLKGQDVADAISAVPTGVGNKPIQPITILSVEVTKR